MNRSDHSRIGRVIEKHYPEVFNEVLRLTKEEMYDTGLIAGMYAHYRETYAIDRWAHKRLFIAAILKMYCPETLHYGLFVKNRICSILAEELGFKERQSISNLIPDIRVNMKIASFKLQVDELCEALKTLIDG
jgi:hypothetical protein